MTQEPKIQRMTKYCMSWQNLRAILGNVIHLSRNSPRPRQELRRMYADENLKTWLHAF